jgi:F-type H+-transporting ATPase subunit b
MAEHQQVEGKPATRWLGAIVGIIMIAIGGTVLNIQLDPGVPLNPGKTVSMIGVLLILFPVIRHFYTKPLEDAIVDRNTQLERTFTEAENLRTEMTSMRTQYESRLAETEARAREQIQAQIKEAQNLRQQLMAEAAAQADELRRKATQDIEREKQRVLAEMRLEVVNLTLDATERILGENIDNERNRRLVEEFVDKVEVPS